MPIHKLLRIIFSDINIFEIMFSFFKTFEKVQIADEVS